MIFYARLLWMIVLMIEHCTRFNSKSLNWVDKVRCVIVTNAYTVVERFFTPFVYIND